MASYNKYKHLIANIDAMRELFALQKSGAEPTEEQLKIIKGYTGFGAIKAILSPASSDDDIVHWSDSDKPLFPLIRTMHELIKENAGDKYKSYIDSLRNSVLTAFYTPPVVVEQIASSIADAGVNPYRILDPSAGMGEFSKAFRTIAEDGAKVVCYEKDIVTSDLLKVHQRDDKVWSSGFESIALPYLNSFDVVASNIPFGDISVFDPIFAKDSDVARKLARMSIHNYFFVKGVDTLREGGLLAFITSQGVMNTASGTQIREWLMKNTNLVSAVRLPNNLFTEHAGTEVGSDLIILQKNSGKTTLSPIEERFTQALARPNGSPWNNYFKSMDQIVHTEWKQDTDPYGKPAMIFTHKDGAEGIARSLSEILKRDFEQNFSLDLYQAGIPLKRQQQMKQQTQEKQSVPEPAQVVVEVQQQTQESAHMQAEAIAVAPQKPLLDLFGQVVAEQTPKRSATPKSERDVKAVATPAISLEPIPYNGAPASWIKMGSILTQDGIIGVLDTNEDGELLVKPLNLPAMTRAKVEGYIEIRDTYNELYNYENNLKQTENVLRAKLNDAYDKFVAKYGELNSRKNNDLVQMDAGGREILYLERAVDGNIIKADIFDHPVAFNIHEVTSVDNAMEALSASLNKYGGVDMEYMTSLLPESSQKDIEAELSGKIYYNPHTKGYDVAERFISGNVVLKAAEIESYLLNNSDDERAKESLKALQDATPEPIPFADLDFNFGERWIPTRVYSRFATDFFGAEINVFYNSSADEFSVTNKSTNANIWDKYCVRSQSRSYDGMALLKYALLNTSPDIKKTILRDGNEIKVRDTEAIQMANAKIDEIRNGFNDWLNSQSDSFKEKMQNRYNTIFNCYVRPQFDGGHQTFPDLDLKGLGIPDLYQSQKDAIWMLKMNGGGICDHEVGAGKTLIMCVAAYEMKRLGLANKPMIIGLKANVSELAHTFRTAYPNAKVLAPTKDDFSSKKRERLFNDIKNNNFDCVILTHDQFKMIPQSPEIQQSILQAELDSVEENLELVRQQGRSVSRAMEKGLVKRRANLETKLKEIALRIEEQRD
ncbi:MAG: N-6 DNA methylase, partial [Rikenellaceae bacterium]